MEFSDFDVDNLRPGHFVRLDMSKVQRRVSMVATYLRGAIRQSPDADGWFYVVDTCWIGGAFAVPDDHVLLTVPGTLPDSMTDSRRLYMVPCKWVKEAAYYDRALEEYCPIDFLDDRCPR